MAERRQMIIEVVADTTTFTSQVRAAVQGVGGAVSVPTGGGGVASGSLPGVPATLVGTASATQAAVAAAMSQAQANAAQYAMPIGASSPNWGMLMQGAMQNAMYPVGASSPNWSYLLSKRTASKAPAAKTGGFLGAPGMMSLLFNGGFGLMEVGGAAAGIRNAEALSGFANTAEEAALLRAEAIEQASGGFFGSLVFGLPNALGIEGSPAQVAQQARQAVAVRRSQDDIRSRRLDIAESGAFRSAYGFGGQTAAEAARAEARSSRQIADLELRARELSSRLGERTPRQTILMGGGDGYQEVNAGGDLVLTGQARDAVTADLATVNSELRNAREQARFDARRRAEQTQDYQREVGTAIQRANLIASGATNRDISRFDLRAAGMERSIGAMRNFGVMGGLLEGLRLATEQAAQQFNFNREDSALLQQIQSGAIADRYRAQGQGFQASLVDAQAATTAAINAEMMGANRPEVIAAMRNAGAANIAALTYGQNRAFTSNVRGLTTSNAVLSAQLANNPLGAQIAAIRGATEDARQSVTGDGLFQDIQRGLISANGALQEQLAARNFNRARADANLHLSGAIERANLGISGGPSRFIRQQISGIVEQTEDDTRGFLRSGMKEEAARRRELGGLQLRQAESDFYRSIQYREASPRGVYGTGTLGDVGGAFAQAQTAVSKAGQGENEQAPTKQQLNDILTILRQILTDGIAAVSG